MKESSAAGGVGCGCIALVLALNVLIGSHCTDYLTKFWLCKDAPMWADITIGLVGGEIVVPAAIITYIADKADLVESKWQGGK